MPLEIGQILLNKYRIEQSLGEGGFGYVYKATDINLDRVVAIKELRAELANSPDTLERFKNEARAINALRNPSIVTLRSYETDGTHHYMVLEFMDGGNLANLIAKRGRLPPAEAALIAKSVCDGLGAAHGAGIVHRDIKPANILLNRDGTAVKISDFGIAHVPKTISNQWSLTRTGTTMGTPWYMSPEQARGERVDTRTDLYAVGVILYEMVAGQTYLDFTSDFFSDVEKIKSTPPRPLPGDVPPGLGKIILKALVKDPNARFQKAEDMTTVLLAFITPGAAITIPETPVSPPRKRALPLPALIGAGIAAVLIVIAAALWAFAGQTTPPPAVTSPITGQIASPTVVALVPTTIAPLPTNTNIPTATPNAVATQTASAEATQIVLSSMQTRVATTLTAVAPTITPTGTPTPTSTPIPTRMNTPVRAFSPIALVSPANGALFSDENFAPILVWTSAVSPLAENEWYRVQVYHAGQMNCNVYTKDTRYPLPASGREPCDPVLWKFNTGDYNWRISLVVRVDNIASHDIEIVNSEGRLFKWNK